MIKKLSQDASSSIKGIIYQFYVALEHCFNLESGQKLYIESFGDITISDSLQIEAKYYSDKLTDQHENFWKSLNNWLKDDFEIDYYTKLILLTTQEYGKNSNLQNWNTKSPIDKLSILKSIKKNFFGKTKQNSKISHYIMFVMNKDNQNKLNRILDKFIILDSSPIGIDYLNKIKDKYAKNIPIDNHDDYINSLIGFITSPQVSDAKNWVISFDDFTQKVKALSEQYQLNTKIFPNINLNITDSDIARESMHLFVKKIEDINYDTAINEAIKHYLITQRLILNEFQQYSVSKQEYDNYENNLIAFYNPKFRKALRNINDEIEIETKSQDFYDDVIGSDAQDFSNFNNTPIYFRNGIYHILANDKEKNIKWRLEGGIKNE